MAIVRDLEALQGLKPAHVLYIADSVRGLLDHAEAEVRRLQQGGCDA
jgi:hypothetical protein